YHTISATLGRRRLFERQELAEIVMASLTRVREQEAYILAYAIMPDHLHVVFAPRAPHTVADVMQSIKGYSAFEMNKVLGRRGRLWQPSYYDRLIRNEKHLRDTIEYVEWNPVTAGFVESPDAYAYSSANPDAQRDFGRWLDDGRG